MHPTQLAQWAGAERQRRSVALQVLGSKSWRRRPDSNRRIGVLQTPPLDHLGTSPQFRVGCPSRIRTSVHGFKVRCPTTRRRGIDPGSPRDWSGRRDSNPRPSLWQCDALPAELHPRKGANSHELLAVLCHNQTVHLRSYRSFAGHCLAQVDRATSGGSATRSPIGAKRGGR